MPKSESLSVELAGTFSGSKALDLLDLMKAKVSISIVGKAMRGAWMYGGRVYTSSFHASHRHNHKKG